VGRRGGKGRRYGTGAFVCILVTSGSSTGLDAQHMAIFPKQFPSLDTLDSISGTCTAFGTGTYSGFHGAFVAWSAFGMALDSCSSRACGTVLLERLCVCGGKEGEEAGHVFSERAFWKGGKKMVYLREGENAGYKGSFDDMSGLETWKGV
jgi:hypothetical protein